MGLDKWNKVYGNRDIEFGIWVKGLWIWDKQYVQGYCILEFVTRVNDNGIWISGCGGYRGKMLM